MRRLKKRCGQSTLEYAILIAVVVGGLIGMQAYVKRGVQGRLRSSTDDIGGQYSPEHVTSTYTIDSSSASTDTTIDGVTSSDITENWRERLGDETVEALDQEDWPN